jgi:hypothetical protein
MCLLELCLLSIHLHLLFRIVKQNLLDVLEWALAMLLLGTN